ncbi:copine iv [Plakobranchus ocellatus]|uniref:Copine iv n=1 Tax=Plakobranchus ocellatus TaxID=259542 RepID=A0AAV4B135_9GAST|nr:copine iv [Plakobranchus ocellatus]
MSAINCHVETSVKCKNKERIRPNLWPEIVDLKISCTNLPRSHSSSNLQFCAVFYVHQWKDQYKEFARTELATGTSDPQFIKTIHVDYQFEAVQHIRVRIYEEDSSSSAEYLEDGDFLGQIECFLGQIVFNSFVSKPLSSRSGETLSDSFVTIRVQEQAQGCDYACMKFAAKKLENKDFLSKSDPFLEICRKRKNDRWQIIYRSPYVKDDLSPKWPPFVLPVRSIFGPDKTSPAKIRVYDWESNEEHELIGEAICNFEDFTMAQDSEFSWPCVNEEKKSKKKDCGKIILRSLQLYNEYSLINYLLHGVQFKITFGVDFTMRNIEHENPASDHFVSNYRINQYIEMLRSLGSVLEHYNAEKQLAAYGFGAEIEPDKCLSHDFPLNFDSTNPNCEGVEGLLEAYTSCRPKMRMRFPRNAGPILMKASQAAQMTQETQPYHYHLLFLLIRSDLDDLEEVRNELVKASHLPLSVIIVGIGEDDFENMKPFGEHDELLTASEGKDAARDNVQFARFHDFKFMMNGPEKLANFVLAKMPNQVTEYFKMLKIPPSHSLP